MKKESTTEDRKENWRENTPGIPFTEKLLFIEKYDFRDRQSCEIEDLKVGDFIVSDTYGKDFSILDECLVLSVRKFENKENYYRARLMHLQSGSKFWISSKDLKKNTNLYVMS